MRRFLLAITLLLTGLGCTDSMTVLPPLSSLPKVGATMSTSLLVGYGYTGGLGSMPVLDELGEIKMIDSVPVYFDESYQKQIAEKLPECYAGTPQVTVRGEVSLEERRDTNTSIPDAPEQKYYMAVVKNLESIEVKTQPCTE